MPDPAPRLEALAMSLARLGWPARLTRLAAGGIMLRLHRWCQDHRTDAIGSASDLGWLIPEWAGDPKVLAAALVSAGLLIVDRQAEGFWVWRALAEASAVRQARWKREAPESARIASLHSNGVYGFGDQPADQPLEENQHGNAFQSLRSRWTQQWRLRHHRPYPYDDGPGEPNLDAARLQRCLRGVRGPDALTRLYGGIDRYLADPSAFYGGHPLGHFAAEMGRWADGA